MISRNTLKHIWVVLFFTVGISLVIAAGNTEQPSYGCHGYGQRNGFSHMNGGGMMGGFYNSNSNIYSERLSKESVTEKLSNYVSTYFGTDFYIEEVMEFERNFYAQIGKEGEVFLATELLIDPYSGQIFPEMGPNMMWNQSYGHMRARFWQDTEFKISAAEAVELAQEYLDSTASGYLADDHVDTFDGYYTLHTLKNGKITGMLSVNAINGDVWYHNWHGEYTDTEEPHDD